MKTDIILNGHYLELITDVSMPFTYQIADIKNPSAKNTNFSKTITLPGTAINNQIFGWLWDTNVTVNSSGTVNFTPSFNPNKKADVVILYDGAEVFKGFMKLDRIKVLADYKIEYDVTCFGKLKDLFLELGEKTMADLDLSKYNHPYTYDVQVASWDNYIYSSGGIGGTIPFNKGTGYVYPMVDYALNNNIDWKTEHFFPAVYYKTLIHEIISQAGFEYDGTIFNDNDFKSLVVSYGGGNLKLSTSQIDNRIFQASKTSRQSLDVSFNGYVGTGSDRNINPTQISFQNDFTPPNYDGGNNYNTSLNSYTVPSNGTYRFTSEFNVSLKHFPLSSGTTTFPNRFVYSGYFYFKKNNTIIASVPLFIQLVSPSFTDTIIYANSSYYIQLNSTITSGSTTPTFNLPLSFLGYFNSGDVVDVNFYRELGKTVSYIGGVQYFVNIYGEIVTFSGGVYNPTQSYMKMNIETNSIFKNNLNSVAVSEGDVIDINTLFGNDIKQKDFISTFFKLFNIYTETDEFNQNLLHFEPRPDFYATSGSIFNWDDKLDYSKTYEVIPMGDLDARTYLYKFKDDTDYWNDYYKKKYLQTYGQKKYEIDNDWLSNINTNEVIFSPTPLVDRVGDDKIIPRIIQINQTGQAVPLSSNANKAANLRLWYYGGVKSTSNPYNYITSSGTNVLSNYAYAGHLDNIDSPNFDVNFYLPIEVYYTATTYTNNNLFNKYYKQFIDEITSRDSRLFKGYFHLNPIDIATLDFRGKFYFHGDYWILNKIYDYNPTEVDRPTLCEFLKLKGGVPFVPTSGTTNGGNDVRFDDDVWPSYNDSIPRDGNIINSDVLVSGSGNVVSPTSNEVVIIGSDNYIGDGARTISLINSSGTSIIGGTRNVTLINSSDLIIDNSYDNSLVINGVKYGLNQIIWKDDTWTFTGIEQDAFAIFEILNDTACYLPYPFEITNGYTIEIKNANKIGKNLTVTIQSDSITPVWSPGEGTTATQHQLTQKQNFRYTYYDGVWYIH